MSKPPTPGTVTGTKIVVFEGGPPEWDGYIAGISKTCTSAERWDNTADELILYHQTDRTKEVPIEREKRTGTVIEMKTAEVFAFAGYKGEELL